MELGCGYSGFAGFALALAAKEVFPKEKLPVLHVTDGNAICVERKSSQKCRATRRFIGTLENLLLNRGELEASFALNPKAGEKVDSAAIYVDKLEWSEAPSGLPICDIVIVADW